MKLIKNGKVHHFAGRQRVKLLPRGLLAVAAKFACHLEAWAVFSNHYHFIAHSSPDPGSLSRMLATLHERSAKWVNPLDA